MIPNTIAAMAIPASMPLVRLLQHLLSLMLGFF